MSKETQAILIVADISGFTRFMKTQIISISHAKQVIVRLLKSIIKVSKTPVKIAELEGDAVFFYAIYDGYNSKTVAEEVKSQILKYFNSFKSEIDILTGLDACSCEACKKTRDLKLKVVVHSGNIQFEKIHKTEKLFGIDVIVVHRMLKNSVPSNEYVMMTDGAYAEINDFFGLKGERFIENFEGIGETNTIVFYPDEELYSKAAEMKAKKSYSIFERLLWKTILSKNTFFDWIGINRIKGTFKHAS